MIDSKVRDIKKERGNTMSLEKFVNATIAGFFAVRAKQSGDQYLKLSHNAIVANKPIKKKWSK